MNKRADLKQVRVFGVLTLLLIFVFSSCPTHAYAASDVNASPSPSTSSSSSSNSDSSSSGQGEGLINAWSPDGHYTGQQLCSQPGVQGTVTWSVPDPVSGLTYTGKTDCTAGPGAGNRCGDGNRANGESISNPDGTTKIYTEECDDNNLISGDGCNDQCQIERCGNIRVDFKEQCDHGANNGQPGDDCGINCQWDRKFCGDGIVQDPNNDGEHEKCDDGLAGNIPGKRCDANCRLTKCGNGVVENPNGVGFGETCDGQPGCRNPPHPDACRSCGDGVKDGVEECDMGSKNGKPDTGCSIFCKKVNYCGDGIKDGAEQCDLGDPTKFPADPGAGFAGGKNGLPGSGCNADCTTNTNLCCNGTVDAGEDCDPGNQGGTEAKCVETDPICDSTCHLRCGNGTVDDGEDCEEDGDCGDSGKECKSCKCMTKKCGDGIIDEGEVCDDGNESSGDGCNYCKFEDCEDINPLWDDTYSDCPEDGCYKETAHITVTMSKDESVPAHVLRCYQCVARIDNCGSASDVFPGKTCAKFLNDEVGWSMCEGGCFSTAQCGMVCPSGTIAKSMTEIMEPQTKTCCSCSSVAENACSNGDYKICNTIASDSSSSDYETGFQPVDEPKCKGDGSSGENLTVNSDGTCSPKCEACTCGAAGASELCDDIIE